MILNITSVHEVIAWSGYSAYTASKAALSMLTKNPCPGSGPAWRACAGKRSGRHQNRDPRFHGYIQQAHCRFEIVLERARAQTNDGQNVVTAERVSIVGDAKPMGTSPELITRHLQSFGCQIISCARQFRSIGLYRNEPVMSQESV
ncbi:hypothetical protein ACFQAT_27500 [Undibacterium arcticum]|uniref:hypothetical protein n=1 Tax=Undibacterium arcticum TaxID=1762892 RepID=UPI00362409EB